MGATLNYRHHENVLTIELVPPFGPIERMECLVQIDRCNCPFAHVLIDASGLSAPQDLLSVRNLLVQLGFQKYGQLAIVANVDNEKTALAIVNWFPLKNPVKVFLDTENARSWLLGPNGDAS